MKLYNIKLNERNFVPGTHNSEIFTDEKYKISKIIIIDMCLYMCRNLKCDGHANGRGSALKCDGVKCLSAIIVCDFVGNAFR